MINLEILSASGNLGLTTLDTSGLESLLHLDISENPSLKGAETSFENLQDINLDACSLPLGRLAPWVGKGRNSTIFGKQSNVIFKELREQAGSKKIDLRSEYMFNGIVTKSVLNPISGNGKLDTSANNGLVGISELGTYTITMSSQSIVSNDGNGNKTPSHRHHWPYHRLQPR